MRYALYPAMQSTCRGRASWAGDTNGKQGSLGWNLLTYLTAPPGKWVMSFRETIRG
ncbi:rCG50015 [Rattus norvegicus]|uniref:RCG50015 n=1 Tax=Rattus norvegicus TaxID=10116 RepID=A6JVI1_RAT|nr:rCG50015 [Rattus norvegicus]